MRCILIYGEKKGYSALCLWYDYVKKHDFFLTTRETESNIIDKNRIQAQYSVFFKKKNELSHFFFS